MSNNITSITRQLIADEIETSKISICGKLNDAEFLNRIFDLEQLPSQDDTKPHLEILVVILDLATTKLLLGCLTTAVLICYTVTMNYLFVLYVKH